MGVAFILRVWGARSSIAYIADTQIIREAMSVAQAMSGDPSYNLNLGGGLKYPLTLPLILLCAYGGIFLLARLSGTVTSVSGFASLLFGQRADMHLVAVVVLAILEVLLIPALYWSARSLRPKHSGWVAASLGAFSPLLVQFGHQPRPHAPLATISFLAAILLVAMANKTGRRWTVAATVVSALTIGTLQDGAVIIIPFALAWVCRAYNLKRQGSSGLAHVLLDFILNLLVLAGLALFLYPALLSEFAALASGMLSGNSQFSLGSGSHLFTSQMLSMRNLPSLARLMFYYEPLATLLAVPAVVYMLAREFRKTTLWVVALPFPAVLLIAFGMYSGTYPRMLAVLVPFLVIPVAYLVEDIMQAARRRAGWVGPVGQSSLAAMLLLPGLITSVRMDWVLSRTDTRTQASRWIETHYPEGTTLTSNFQLLELAPSRESLLRQQAVDPESLGTYGQWLLRLEAKDYPAPPTYDIVDPNAYRLSGVQELQALFRDRGIGITVLAIAPQLKDFDLLTGYALEYGRLAREFRPASGTTQGFLPDDFFAPVWREVWQLERPGPTVLVVEMQPSAQAQTDERQMPALKAANP